MRRRGAGADPRGSSSSSSRARSARSTRWRGCSSRPVRSASPPANKAARGYRLARTGDGGRRRRGRAAPARRASRPRRRWRRRPATCCATASGRSPPTWRSSPTAPPSRGRTSSASACAGCGPRSRSSARASARRRWRRSPTTARRLGRVAGELRDADVLMSEVVAGAARRGLDPAARGGARRRAGGAPRPGARARCARRWRRPRRRRFLFDLGAFIEGRGWLVAVRLLPDRAPRGADRRGGAGHPRPPPPPGDEARAQGARARRRRPARAAQGAEEAALHRRHVRAALRGRADARPTSGR